MSPTPKRKEGAALTLGSAVTGAVRSVVDEADSNFDCDGAAAVWAAAIPAKVNDTTQTAMGIKTEAPNQSKKSLRNPHRRGMNTPLLVMVVIVAPGSGPSKAQAEAAISLLPARAATAQGIKFSTGRAKVKIAERFPELVY